MLHSPDKQFDAAAEVYWTMFGEGVPFMLLPEASFETWSKILRQHVEAGEPISLESLERLTGIPNDVPETAVI